jgi:beta-glucanase (GH16 family)
LVWADEFETDGAINSNNWYHQTQLINGDSWANGEEQHYTDRIENSFVDNGFLNIVAINESYTDQGETKQYTSARLNSKFAFTYGRVDVRAKLPFGDGTWPAIWTLGKNINEDGAYWDNQGFGTTPWPACGEIDIMEHGLGAVNHVSSALHTPSSFGATVNYQAYVLNDVANEFHVYSVNWSPNQITFLIDDVGFYTYNPAVKNDATWPFYEDQYLLLNIAMGGISGEIDPNFTQSSMVIDYVRVYQNVALSLDDEFASTFGVYPNPTSDKINITSKEPIDRIELYDVLGKVVLRQEKNLKTIDVSQIMAGVYVLKIYSNNQFAIKRVIIN